MFALPTVETSDARSTYLLNNEFGGQHIVSGQIPPQSAQTQQLMANGTTGAQAQQANAMGFVMPTVEGVIPPNHMPATTAYISNQRPTLPQRNWNWYNKEETINASYREKNRNNPSLHLTAGEVQIEPRSQQGISQVTVRRFPQQPQQQQQFTPTSQVTSYSQAPPSALPSYNYSFSAGQGVYSQAQPIFYPLQGQTVYFPAQTECFPQQVNFIPQTIIAQSVPQTVPPQNRKRILKIVDPETREVTNEREITASMSAPTEDRNLSGETQGGRRPSALDAVRENISVPSNLSKKFSRQVAQSVLGGKDQSVSVASTSAIPTTDIETEASASAFSVCVPAPSTSSPTPVQEEERKYSVDEPVESNPKGSNDHEVHEITSQVALITDETPTESLINIEVNPAPDDVAQFENGKDLHILSQAASTSEPEEPQEIQENKEELPTIRETSCSMDSANGASADETDKFETEKGSVSKVEELKEAMIESKLCELENKRSFMLQEKEGVRTEDCFYDRNYLLLVRIILKETNENKFPDLDDKLCSLGIDIASATAVGPQSRRYDNAGSGNSRGFIPNWISDKNISKQKAYPGRLSDRGHAGQRDRRKPPVTRPSIDRTVREQVKLHKAENAWKPEKMESDKKLYKDIRALLNKITPSTFAPLSSDFLNYKVYNNEEHMSEVIDIIFDKAVEEPKFCPLYSDLCKKQVLDENSDMNTAKFRSGILTRCQQTFETKRQDEIKKKKKEAEEEQDEVKQKELKIEAMEMEAKERRRMFGNIGFIGQLYRHELIVPKILNWCIIHLLKSHCETEGGDEESVECAVRMIETVGKVADRQPQHPDFDLEGFCSHMKSISANVSNRVRFLILNLLELRENQWNPRKSTDQGPKTIKQVHEEARKEELKNKMDRDLYEQRRMPYEGRGSADRRNVRQTIIGARPSQDGRGYGSKRHEASKDVKNARAAGAAISVAPTASKKNLSLNSMDQEGLLGARRPQFSQGSGGGGQHQERKPTSRVSMRGYASLRGSMASREGSQPSSREPSESRKFSLDSEKELAGAAAVEIMHGGLPRAGSAFAGMTSSMLEESANDTGSDTNEQMAEAELREEPTSKELYAKFSTYIRRYATDEIDIDEAQRLILETCQIVSPRRVFYVIVQIGTDKGGKAEGTTYRRYIGQVMCKCLQTVEIKEEALRGIADFCNFIVEAELWEDNMRIWEDVAEMIIWSVMCNTDHFSGPRPSLVDFREAFHNSNADTRSSKKNQLLVVVLTRMVEITRKNGGSAGMMFDEIGDLKTESLLSELKAYNLPGESISLLDLLK